MVNAYANTTGDLVPNVFLNRGKFVVIELNPKDPMARTTFTDFEARKTYRLTFEYKIKQNAPVKTVDGKMIEPIALKTRREKRLVIDDFLSFEFEDK